MGAPCLLGGNFRGLSALTALIQGRKGIRVEAPRGETCSSNSLLHSLSFLGPLVQGARDGKVKGGGGGVVLVRSQGKPL